MNSDSASPSGGTSRIRAIPRTISAVTEALPHARRGDFRAAVAGAGEGGGLDTVMTTWWLEAMFESIPGRDQRLDDTVAAVGLVELPEEEG